MKLIVFASAVVFLLILLFVFGAFTGSAALVMPAFCTLPFAFIALGYTIGRAGLYISISTDSTQSRVPRRKGAAYDG